MIGLIVKIVSKVDELGFKSVDLSRTGHKSDSFILASQAKQVFYAPDQLDPKWSIVLSSHQRTYYDEDNNDDLIRDEISTNTLPNVEFFDVIDESPSNYARDDCEGTWIDHSKS